MGASAFQRARVAALLAAGALVAACASAPRTGVEEAQFRDLGEVPLERLANAVESVLIDERGLGLRQREEQYATVYYETVWHEREPFPDERARGVTEARSRVVVRGQRTESGAYRVTLEGENEVRTEERPGWHTRPTTPDFRQWVGEIERALSARFDSSGDDEASAEEER